MRLEIWMRIKMWIISERSDEKTTNKLITKFIYLCLDLSQLLLLFWHFFGLLLLFWHFLSFCCFLALSLSFSSYNFLLAIQIGSSAKSKPPTVQVTPFSHFIQMICFNLHWFFWWNVCSVLCHGMVVSVVQFLIFVLALDSRLVFYPDWIWAIEVICLAKFGQWKVISKLWRQN